MNGRNGKTNTGQALEGKDVKDLLLNVGSGGGAAPAAGAVAAGAPAAEAAKEEEKVEGKQIQADHSRGQGLTATQIRRSPMRIWASVFSIKRLPVHKVCTSATWPRLLPKRCNIGLVWKAL